MRAAAIKSIVQPGATVNNVLAQVSDQLPSLGNGIWEKSDYRRDDKRNDEIFYKKARFEHHMQEDGLRHLCEYYSANIPNGLKHIDVCSSFDSHFNTYKPKYCVGIGLNGEELAKNTALDSFTVQDFNANEVIPFKDDSFDVATHVASIEYIVNPLVHMEQVRRVLAPSSTCVIAFTTRAFWTKATRIWKQLDHNQRVVLVASYLSHAGFHDITAEEITPPGVDEPIAVVCGKA